jgi:beta-lactamase superfamily II metal-dependent hydrolase
MMKSNPWRRIEMKKIFLTSLCMLVGVLALSVLFYTVRQMIARAQVERDWQMIPTSVPDLETTTRLQIIPLYEEDRTEERFDFGHGVSYLISTDSATILMDLGNNPAESAQLPALQNMHQLGISWEEIGAIVISHPHPDHMGGVQAWQENTLAFGDFTDHFIPP